MKPYRWKPWAATALALYALGFAASFDAHAQDESEERVIYRIEPAADERIPEGKSSFLQGETDAEGTRFLVEGTGILQPIAVGVYTKNPDSKLRVRVVKDSFDKPERDAATDGEGRAEFKFRTFDSFKLWITADEPTEYQLVVWIGDEIALPIPSVAVPASEFREPAGGATPAGASAPASAGGGVSLSYLELGLIATLLLVVVGFALFIVSRRKAS